MPCVDTCSHLIQQIEQVAHMEWTVWLQNTNYIINTFADVLYLAHQWNLCWKPIPSINTWQFFLLQLMLLMVSALPCYLGVHSSSCVSFRLWKGTFVVNVCVSKGAFPLVWFSLMLSPVECTIYFNYIFYWWKGKQMVLVASMFDPQHYWDRTRCFLAETEVTCISASRVKESNGFIEIRVGYHTRVHLYLPLPRFDTMTWILEAVGAAAS